MKQLPTRPVISSILLRRATPKKIHRLLISQQRRKQSKINRRFFVEPSRKSETNSRESIIVKSDSSG
jgi:hypothetical protein